MSKRIINIIVFTIILGLISYMIFDFVNTKNNKTKEFEKMSELIFDDDGELLTDNYGNPVQYGAHKGDMMYDYELKDVHTGEIVKISDFRGKRVFLNFWASWCPPCKAEAPHLQKFHEENEDIVVLGINVKDSEKELGAEFRFIDEYNLTFTNTYAPEELYYVFPISSFPTSLFINSEGIIEEGVIGPLSTETIEAKFKEID